MTEYAGTVCQRKCEIVTGPVSDICEVSFNGYDDQELVIATSRNGSASSRPLVDRGDGEEGNLAYLRALQNCTGPNGRKLFGRLPCQAIVQGEPLSESVVTIR